MRFLPALVVLAACTAPDTPVADTGTTAPVVAQADGTPAEAFIVETTTTVAVQIIPPARVHRERPTTEAPNVIPDGAIQETICAIFGDACADALEVAECESGFDPSKTGSAGERGLFQLHPIHREWIESLGYTWDAMYQVEPNVQVAFYMWDAGGWDAWSCRPG